MEKAPCASHDPPAPVPAAPRRPLSPIPPPCPPLLPLLPGWPPASQGGCPKGQKSAFWAPKPLFGPKNDFWRQKCILARKKRKMGSKNAKMEKWSSKHQRNHCLEQHLRKGAKMTPKGAPKRKKRFFTLKTAFCAQNHFFTKKCGNERKSAKRVKMGFRIPKKALSTEGLAPWAQNERLRGPKTQNFAKNRTLAPKTRSGRFLPF